MTSRVQAALVGRRKGSWLAALTVGSLAALGPASVSSQRLLGSNGEIAYESNQDGNFEIYLMQSDGSSPTRLTNNKRE